MSVVGYDSGSDRDRRGASFDDIFFPTSQKGRGNRAGKRPVEPQYAGVYITPAKSSKAGTRAGERQRWTNTAFIPFHQRELAKAVDAWEQKSRMSAKEQLEKLSRSQQDGVLQIIEERNRAEKNPNVQWILAHARPETRTVSNLLYSVKEVYKLEVIMKAVNKNEQLSDLYWTGNGGKTSKETRGVSYDSGKKSVSKKKSILKSDRNVGWDEPDEIVEYDDDFLPKRKNSTKKKKNNNNTNNNNDLFFEVPADLFPPENIPIPKRSKSSTNLHQASGELPDPLDGLGLNLDSLFPKQNSQTQGNGSGQQFDQQWPRPQPQRQFQQDPIFQGQPPAVQQYQNNLQHGQQNQPFNQPYQQQNQQRPHVITEIPPPPLGNFHNAQTTPRTPNTPQTPYPSAREPAHPFQPDPHLPPLPMEIPPLPMDLPPLPHPHQGPPQMAPHARSQSFSGAYPDQHPSARRPSTHNRHHSYGTDAFADLGQPLENLNLHDDGSVNSYRGDPVWSRPTSAERTAASFTPPSSPRSPFSDARQRTSLERRGSTSSRYPRHRRKYRGSQLYDDYEVVEPNVTYGADDRRMGRPITRRANTQDGYGNAVRLPRAPIAPHIVQEPAYIDGRGDAHDWRMRELDRHQRDLNREQRDLDREREFVVNSRRRSYRGGQVVSGGRGYYD